MNPIYVKYSKLPVTIQNRVLSHSMSPVIMSYQEEYLMLKSAEVVCQNGGDILNVGYGLGIVDDFIRNQTINSHHIIEIHPQLYQNAVDAGFQNVHLGDWRDVIQTFIDQGKKFNGIYFDTHNFGAVDEWYDFVQQVDSILAPGGIFSYFNIIDRIAVEEYISNNLNYAKHLTILPLQTMQDHLNQSWDNTLLAPRDYKLIYFIK